MTEIGWEMECFSQITAEETLELVKRFQETGDIVFRNTLMEGNLRLVLFFVTWFLRGANLEPDDLVQEGSLGFMDATTYERYSPEKGAFSTWVGYRIRKHVSWAIAKERARGMCKTYFVADERSIFVIERRLQKKLGRKPTVEEISEQLKKPVEHVLRVLDLRRTLNSFLPTAHLDWQQSKSELAPLDRLIVQEELEECWRRVMNFLPWMLSSPLITPINKETFLMRYGFHDGSLALMEMREVGERMSGESRACIFERLKAVWKKVAFCERNEDDEWMREQIATLEELETILGDNSRRLRYCEELKRV